MLVLREARIPILDDGGAARGTVHISLLPATDPAGPVPPLVNVGPSPEADPSLPPVQLLESEEYRYQIELHSQPTAITTDKPDVLQADTVSGVVGRIRPRLNTGTLSIGVCADGVHVGYALVEVRSRKLEYLKHFRWMLGDIADKTAEIVMERFAPAEQRFAIDESADATTLYQRFAFLRSLLTDDSLEAGLHQILSRPYVAWIDEEELRSPGQGGRASSGVARHLASPGRRVACPPHLQLPISSLPEKILWARTDTTLDNLPNQFVKFALTRWRDVLLLIRLGLERSTPSASTRRGLQETGVIVDYLDGLLGEELFREVADLSTFPAGNQVLQRREGYRDVLRAYLQFELAAKLAWKGGDDVYRAGQRDVAALYEYWSFLQLAKVVARLCDAPFDFSSLVEVDEHGLGITLRRGRATLVSGTVLRLGRRLRLELAFNRTFPKGTGSWSTELRPDCSLEIRSDDPDHTSFEAIWLHFDAKYRVETLAEVFSVTLEDVPSGEAKRSDLLKMHAYRDAIRRSAGAYVLYPGSEQKLFREYHEILPGLGAFVLMPTNSGDPIGADALGRFLDDVLDHVALQITQHERGRYWRRRVYERTERPVARAPAASFLPRPPADTRVLLGYVRGPDHLEWIQRTCLYNLRAMGRRGRVGLGSSELSADLVVLYGHALAQVKVWQVQGAPELHTRSEMETLGYPNPRGEAYYCLPLRELDLGDWGRVLTPEAILELRSQVAPEAPRGWPVTTSWLRLAEVAWKDAGLSTG